MLKTFAFFQAAGTAAGGATQGELYSWGSNGSGRTGLGTDSGNTLSPTQVGSFDDWTISSGGSAHSCGIRNGLLYGWGSNGEGRNGLGLSAGTTLTPTQITGFSDWFFVSCGNGHSMAIRNGRLYAFGNNVSDVLGVGSSGNKLVPTEVVGSHTDWIDVTVGNAYTLGIRGGALFGWGFYTNGELGLGNASGTVTTPTQAGSFTDWVKVSNAPTGTHVLGIRNGLLYAWGTNSNGVTGLNTTVGTTNTPTQVGVLTGWTDIAGGAQHSLGIRNGMLYAWGRNFNGATGLGISSDTNTLTPTQVGTDTDWAYVSAGSGYSIAIKTNGTVWSFGPNFNGQTGLGTDSGNTLTPTQIGSTSGWIVPDTGSNHSFAILGAGAPPPPPPPPSDEGLFTWGQNNGYQLGHGDTTQRTSPDQVDTDTTWTDVLGGGSFDGATGQSSYMAFIKNGSLLTVGANASGQTGQNTTTGFTQTPTAVQGSSFSDWLRLGSSGNSGGVASAIRDGRLYTWGSNSSGRTGQNTTTGTTNVPTQIPAATVGWTDVSLGGAGSNAIQDGKLFGCGVNDSNGIGGAGTTNVFTQVGSFNDWTVVRQEGNAGAGIRNGRLYTWGVNSNFATGQGTSSGSTANPTIPTGTDVAGWTTCDVGNSFGLAVKNGELWAWGQNGSGQFGNGTTTQATTPIQIGSATDWLDVKCAVGYSLALKKNGTIWATGGNVYGATGLGTNSGDTLTWTQVGTGTDWYKLTAGIKHSGGLRGTPTWAGAVEGNLVGFGTNNNGQLGLANNTNPINRPTVAGAFDDWDTVYCGAKHTLAIRNGLLYTTGENVLSQLGNGNTTASNVFINIGAFADWFKVAGGDRHSLGIRNGLLYSWGNNANGATGRNTATGTTTTPTQVGSDIDWTHVAACDNASWGIRANGTLWAWGRNDSDRLGLNSATSQFLNPTQIGTDTDWSFVAPGYINFGMALKTDGTLWSWGRNDLGSNGLGLGSGSTPAPLQVGSDTGWTHVAGGYTHGLGIRNGVLYAWGQNIHGNIGDGTTTTRMTPVQITGFDDWEWVGAGHYTSCAIRKGKLYVWGRNTGSASLLGIQPENADRLSPILVSAHETYKFVSVGNQGTDVQHTIAIRK
jgi:alpha-tubulin suppressor-like RCC1 family protein